MFSDLHEGILEIFGTAQAQWAGAVVRTEYLQADQRRARVRDGVQVQFREPVWTPFGSPTDYAPDHEVQELRRLRALYREGNTPELFELEARVLARREAARREAARREQEARSRWAAMSPDQRARQRRYNREWARDWRQAHLDEARERSRAYWASHPEYRDARSQYSRDWWTRWKAEVTPEALSARREYGRAWRAQHPDYMKQYRANHREDPAKQRARYAALTPEQKSARRAYQQAYRARRNASE